MSKKTAAATSKSKVLAGDCVQTMQGLEESSIDAIVTDPPYGLKFMGKDWDDAGDGPQQQEWHRLWAVEALRVLKPGGHLLAFGGSRTYHRLASAVEDAGFEIRDQIMWLYGSGFPKSLNVSKAIDKQRDDRAEILQVADWLAPLVKAKGVEAVANHLGVTKTMVSQHWCSHSQTTVPTLDQVPKLLEVLSIDPADVPDEIARLLLELNGRKGQPGENWFKREILEERTMIQGGGNSLQLRVGERKEVEANITAPATEQAHKWDGWGTALKPAHEPIVVARKPLIGTVAANVLKHGTGAINIDGCRVEGERWPANLILDEEVGEQLGEPARFFYCAKAGKAERNAGLDKNIHPTVKPISLMAYLVRLVTPPGGVILDPFLGSGSTGCAAVLEGFDFIGIEREAEYVAISKARIKHYQAEAKLAGQKLAP